MSVTSSPASALRARFPITKTHIFLNHAGVAPTSTEVVDAVHGFMDGLATPVPDGETLSIVPAVAGG